MSGVPREWKFDEVYDTLDRGCGDFLLELRGVFASLEAGTRLMLASRDAGAPLEVPAWCRLVGHRLHEASPPYYLIEKRDVARKKLE
jgi:tRNA 2-thiouridine synthesizing protein A